jgi:hypothetical protein
VRVSPGLVVGGFPFTVNAMSDEGVTVKVSAAFPPVTVTLAGVE